MRPSLGAMGAPVLTPHMDHLAAESLLFDRAFANFPWCNPSRSTSPLHTYTPAGPSRTIERSCVSSDVRRRCRLPSQIHCSRAGRRPDTNKVWNFNVDLRTTWEKADGPKNGNNASYITLPQHFKQNGYYTTSVRF